jgi:hypothetical protein
MIQKQYKCPICGSKVHRTRDGWKGAPWQYVCLRGSCHFAGDVRTGAKIRGKVMDRLRETVGRNKTL